MSGVERPSGGYRTYGNGLSVLIPSLGPFLFRIGDEAEPTFLASPAGSDLFAWTGFAIPAIRRLAVVDEHRSVLTLNLPAPTHHSSPRTCALRTGQILRNLVADVKP